MKSDIIVIGAGAAGLMAAKELCNLGYIVTLLEAMPYAGGRIRTLQKEGFSSPIEAGAEFIHGNLPVTLSLLQEAGIGTQPFEGEILEHKDGTIEEEDGFVETNRIFRQRLKELEEDISVAQFFEKYFSEEKYADVRESVKRYIEGYEAADITKASMMAMSGDLLEQDEEQFRPANGYQQLVDYLLKQCIEKGCRIMYSSPVTEVHWQRGSVKVITASANYTAQKLLCTVPLGVLREVGKEGSVLNFQPAITAKALAASKLGWGVVTKILLEFNYAFWHDKDVLEKIGGPKGNIAFIFSRQRVPTWWTQLPRNPQLLTGWLAGPAAEMISSDETIIQQALASLSAIFEIPVARLKDSLRASYIANWKHEPFIKGAYSYSTVGYEQGLQELMQPEEDTLFFAGEAIYNGPHSGTVEAALASALNVVKDIQGS